MLLTPSKRIKVSRPTVLWPPVVTADGIYVGSEDEDILKLDRSSLETVWRVPAEGFRVGASFGTAMLLYSDTGECRLLRASGEVAWTLDVGGANCTIWRDRLLIVDGGLRLADMESGQIVERIEMPGAPCDLASIPAGTDVLAFQVGEQGELYRAYDLVDRRVLWEANLIQELKAQYGVKWDSPTLALACGSEGRLVGTRGKSIFGLSLEDGHVLWHAGFWVPYYWPAVHSGRVYAWARGEDSSNHLVCLEEATGHVVYDIPLNEYGGDFALPQQPSQGAIGGEYIAFATRAGLFAVFWLTDGNLAGSYRYKTTLVRPVSADRRFFVTTDDGSLLVFEDKG